MVNPASAAYVMWYRQVKRFIRTRSRLVGAILQPIFWMIFLGLGFTSALKGAPVFGGIDYLTFFTPGVVVMAVFFTAFFSGISVIWDREFGFLKEILVAPASRTATIAGRILGDVTISMLQGVIVLTIAFLMVPNLRLLGVPLVLVAVFFTALQFTGLGIALASKLKSFEGFQLVNMLIAMPIFFLSGAFYPVNALPAPASIIAYLNPLVYGVDLSRTALTGAGFLPLTSAFAALAASSLFLLVVAVWGFKKATAE
ncbi:MAG: daunorubicin resistance ABC transporter inner membrane subunit B [Candidatus Hecatellales archaeon B24]|nr:MAG: daunorubicin resistance ABC transporter inner membrane subunit B [Candidatus Hecatellales archaeon B24]